MKVLQSYNQSYTEIGSVYHRAYLCHILIPPPLRSYSERGVGIIVYAHKYYFTILLFYTISKEIFFFDFLYPFVCQLIVGL